MGVAARGLGKYEEALKLYDQARDLDQNNPMPHWNRAILHQQYLNKADKAVADYGEYLKLAPTKDKKDREQARVRIKNLKLMMKYQAEEEAASSAAPKGAPDSGDDGAEGGGEPAAEGDSGAGDDAEGAGADDTGGGGE
jgi:tetratricopeptide (TPR) repeat protein